MKRIRAGRVEVGALTLAAAAWLAGGAGALPPAAAEHGDSATIRHSFADVERWVAVFDDTARAAWQMPGELVAALGLGAGARVADIGAGTGYFNPHFARAVGDSGRVYAADIEPGLVRYMAERAKREATPQVEPILATADDPHLPDGLDLIFICDTYHHIDGRRAYFTRLRGRLAPGGRLAIVDFKPGELPVGPPPEHRILPEAVIAELAAAGFELVEQPDLLPYQYFLIFRPKP